MPMIAYAGTAIGRRRSGPNQGGLLTAAALGVLLASCGSDDGECRTDVQCGMTEACVHRACVARLAASETAVWSVEVVPAASSPYAARELPSFSFTSVPATLPVDRKVSVAATITRSGEGSPTPTSVNVTARVPSSIAGRRNLTFETQAANQGGSSPYEMTLSIPERLLGQTARLTVAPVAPLNRTLCPWWVDLSLALMTTVALPEADDTIALHGLMETVDPGRMMPIEYEARIFVGDSLASNLARTDATGRFDLEVQRSWALRPEVNARVEIAAADSSLPIPTLSLPLPPAGGDIGVLRMPSHAAPVSVVVPVVDEGSMKGVPGAMVRLTATLEGAVGGEARYVRTAQTGADGKASLVVVPMAQGRPVEYAVKVVPAADSESGPRCLRAYSVAAPAADGSRIGPTISLPRRAVLDGRVVRADGRAAPGLRVRATRTGDVYSEECGGPLSSPPAESATDDDGRYRLRLDPGDYRIDYEPEAASALPWAVEEQVSILTSIGREVSLPAAILVEGLAVDVDGKGLARAEVRAFTTGSDGRAELRGSAVADGSGRFRLVLPRQAPAGPGP